MIMHLLFFITCLLFPIILYFQYMIFFFLITWWWYCWTSLENIPSIVRQSFEHLFYCLVKISGGICEIMLNMSVKSVYLRAKFKMMQWLFPCDNWISKNLVGRIYASWWKCLNANRICSMFFHSIAGIARFFGVYDGTLRK